ncbi:hypothetical protein HPB47_026912 [Ixodes persulcatus]|uniref:Uncharacterized protein n=1 Tax=Ixodes persulcatus TaxID=34615 RepID=A0AC60PXX9_IXOPE|nr:hypothetical protein HPB47_026912 [Ixodes persulcatus]
MDEKVVPRGSLDPLLSPLHLPFLVGQAQFRSRSPSSFLTSSPKRMGGIPGIPRVAPHPPRRFRRRFGSPCSGRPDRPFVGGGGSFRLDHSGGHEP